MAADGEIHKLDYKKQAKIIYTKFAIGDTKASTKYSIAGVADREIHAFASEAAVAQLKKTAPELLATTGVLHQGSYARFGLRIEHMIPTEVVTRHWSEMVAKGKLTEKYLERTIRERIFCAIITKEEDAQLTKLGLRSKMPEAWDFEKGDILARYKKAGITMHAFKA